MKKFFLALGLVALMAAGCDSATSPTSADAFYPEPTGYVVDSANILSEATKAKLTADLTAFDKYAQVAIVTVKTTAPMDLEGYSIKLAEKFKVGHKSTSAQVVPNAMGSYNNIVTNTTEADDGVIFLVAYDDHKMRIEVGRGLEGKLTDAQAGQILDNIVRPLFKQGKYDEGVLAGEDAIMKAVK